MPYYWRRRFYPRRRRFWTRRIRGPLSRRWRRRKTIRRRFRLPYRVRRRHFKRKLKFLKLIQFQPETIRRCRIIGTIPLFQGSSERANNNYIQTIYSYVPQDEPGGGGWTIMIESLSSLWDDFQHLKNFWTQSNVGLPLFRYLKCYLTFWQSPYTDYIVQVSNCLPMVDTKYTHADSCPQRMLAKRHTIKVPSLETRKRKKPYKRIKVLPPQQMMNKWYFQKDACNIPLLMIIATSVDFRYPFAASKAQSNNITLDCLNPEFFQNHDFVNFSVTQGYQPKLNTYLYAWHQHEHDPNDYKQHPTAANELIYLGNTKDNVPGTPLTQSNYSQITSWGNPFYHEYLTGQRQLYTSTKKPSDLVSGTSATENLKQVSKLTIPLIRRVRYNPEKDKGESNTIYLVQNFVNSAWTQPTSENLKMSGFPLHIMTWGIIDWWEKLHEATNIQQSYIFCIITDQFSDKFAPYIIIDSYFEEGTGPYLAPLTTYDTTHWHPKVRFQTKSIHNLAMSGPGCPRTPFDNYMQAKVTYDFHLKWGGCPKTIEKPYDPCSQPNWNIPSNLTAGLQIENPNTDPTTILQKWDWRRDYITEKALKRIKTHSPTDENLQILTDSARNPPILRQTSETEDETSSSEEEKTPLLQTQLKQLKRTQQLLKRRIHRLTTQL
nr:MAG: ORF1 [TTV-like mini virus]